MEHPAYACAHSMGFLWGARGFLKGFPLERLFGYFFSVEKVTRVRGGTRNLVLQTYIPLTPRSAVATAKHATLTFKRIPLTPRAAVGSGKTRDLDLQTYIPYTA